MNRRERKHLEKKLGLDKFYKSMTFAQRMEKMRNNIENGKRMQEETKKRITAEIQQQDDKKESDVIAHNAKLIAKVNNIPMIDAMSIAKEEYDKTKK